MIRLFRWLFRRKSAHVITNIRFNYVDASRLQ